MIRGLTDIGHLSANFAERFTQNESIPVVGGSLRGTHGRRVQFWPASGRVRQVLLKYEPDPLFRAEYQTFVSKPPHPAASSELFYWTLPMDRSTQLVKILDNIAEEINDLGISIDELQAMLSPALSTIASEGDFLRHVQAFDLASQRLNALSSFMSSLNGSIPHHYVVDSSSALSGIKLSALAQRLMGQVHTAQDHVSGELDLF